MFCLHNLYYILQYFVNIWEVLGIVENRQEMIKEKEWYREGIIEMVNKISNPAILNYIYIIVSDVAKEDKDGKN